MDGQDYGFDIQEEEFDIMEDAPSINSTKTPIAKYNKANEASEEDVPVGLEGIDLLNDDAQDVKKDELKEDGNEDEEEDEGSEEDVVEDNDVFQKVADNLVAMGLFVPEEGEDKVVITKPEELATRFEKSYQRKGQEHADNLIKSIVEQGPEWVDMWDKVIVKGLNPYDYFTAQAKIDSIAELDVEDPEHQKQIVRTYYQKQGLPADRIETKIQQAVDLDDLGNDAKVFQGLLIQAEEKNLAEAATKAADSRKQEEAQHTSYASSIHNILTEKLKDKEYEGIPLTPKAVERAVDFVYTYKYKGPDGKLLTEADVWYLKLKENPAMAAKMALLASTDLDITKIQKKSQSQSKDALFTDLVQTQKVVKRKTPTQTQSDNFFD